MIWHQKEYGDWIIQKGYRPSTRKAYLWHLEKFIQYSRGLGLGGVEEITPKHLKEYKVNLFKSQSHRLTHYHIRTINYFLRVVKSFLVFLAKEGYVAGDLSKEVLWVKEPKELPQVILSDQQIKKILKVPDLHHPLGYRDRTILELLYSTGDRRNELLNLNIDDLDMMEGYCRIIQGKGGKDRIVPMGKTARIYLENYIKGVRPQLTKNTVEKALFVNHWGERLGADGLSQMIHRRTRQAKIEKNVTPHVFRRSCATGMIKNKAHPYYVKELLGHENLSSLEPYLKLTIVDLKEVHRRCHPREKERSLNT